MKYALLTFFMFFSLLTFGNETCIDTPLTEESLALSDSINDGSISIEDASSQLWQLSRDTVITMNIDRGKIDKLFDFRHEKALLDYKHILDADPVKQKAVNDYINNIRLQKFSILSPNELDIQEAYAADNLDEAMGSSDFRFFGFYHLGNVKKDSIHQESPMNEASLSIGCNCASNRECWGSVCNNTTRCSKTRFCGPRRNRPCHFRCSRF